jgi:steroid 5-alpha reductase family enzyme
MMMTLQAFLTAALVIAVAMVALWILSIRLKNTSIVDALWGTGFVIVTVVYYFIANGDPSRKLLGLFMLTLWGLRLSLHLLLRNWGKGEDSRYQQIRAGSGESFWWKSLFVVFGLQGLLILIISLPLLTAQASPTPQNLTLLDFLGFLVWTIGLCFEAVGDWQLQRFKNNPANKGKVLTSGLWGLTRHPNYFGDALVWWGLFLVAVGTQGGFFTIISPLIMTTLLMRVSGVALLERSLKQTKPEYEAYMKSVPAFIPKFRR